ncbi:MAG: right-handed parallel beta-helix repeat-containing protein [Candidatus Thorarchaeota archaeon]
MNKSTIVSTVLIILIIIFSTSSGVVYHEEPESVEPQNIGHQMTPAYSYTLHSPITITSNADFSTQGWPGNGTSEKPYVIEGLNVTANAICVSIRYTTVFFIVKNCLISSGIQSSYDGISINRVANGTIQDCIVIGGGNGIFVDYSFSCNIVGNTVSSCSHNGIYVEDSRNCTLKNNSVSSCSNSGFCLPLTSGNCILINNTAKRNGWDGFVLSGWGTCTLANNTALDNLHDGFFIDSFENSTVLFNIASNNSNYGFYLHALVNCTMTHNAASNSSHAGIKMMCGFSGIFSNNTLGNMGLAIDNFRPSDDIEISYNTVNNKPLGYFWDVTSTIINANQYGQIIMANCDLVLVKDGVFINTSMGIQLFSCNDCTLMNNTVSSNSRGIYLGWCCYNCTLTNNTVSNNSLGILLDFSDDCIFVNNTISNNSHGIYVSRWCNENTFYLNRFTNNEENAYDNGEFNSWDDGVSLGNYWADYNGTGPYWIPGSAGSVDNFPFGRLPDDYSSLILVLFGTVSILGVVVIVFVYKRKYA